MLDSVRYVPRSGRFYWTITRANMKPGDRAGCLNSSGYRQIQYAGAVYLEHQLAVWFMTGSYPKFPMQHIDHLNGNRADNRWSNLRVVTSRQNQQNQLRHRKGRLVGATWDKERGLWMSGRKENGKRIFLGRYETEQEAHSAYMRSL